MKIKTFDFEISNLSIYNNGDIMDSVITKRARNITSPEEIDTIINAWVEAAHAAVYDVKVTTYTAERHNNCCGDWVRARYTILYTDRELDK